MENNTKSFSDTLEEMAIDLQKTATFDVFVLEYKSGGEGSFHIHSIGDRIKSKSRCNGTDNGYKILDVGSRDHVCDCASQYRREKPFSEEV